jgi:2'-5' RNA ligase
VPRLLACLFLPEPIDREIRRTQERVAGYRPVLPPHITLAPPADEGFPRDALRAACRGLGPLDLSIGPPGTFGTAELVVYLTVSGPGEAALARIHQALTGRTYGFVPHITVLRGRPLDQFEAAMAAARDLCWSRVRVHAVQVVSMSRNGGDWSWRPDELIALTRNGDDDAAMP